MKILKGLAITTMSIAAVMIVIVAALIIVPKFTEKPALHAVQATESSEVKAAEKTSEQELETSPDPTLEESYIEPADLSDDEPGVIGREGVIGTWDLYSFQDPNKIISRVTYREDNVIQGISSPDTKFEKTYEQYYRIKPDEKWGFVMHVYENESAFNLDESSSPVVISEMTSDTMTFLPMIVPSGQVMSDQPQHLYRVE